MLDSYLPFQKARNCIQIWVQHNCVRKHTKNLSIGCIKTVVIDDFPTFYKNDVNRPYSYSIYAPPYTPFYQLLP
jgi:hypothetical protein